MSLGSITSVSVREIWPGEATNFTPWLADNIEKISQELGLEIEVVATEAAAGSFSIDIIGKEISTNKIVVIENQFGSTDHKHLGQIITYASNANASIIIWIAESFRQEHRTAINFLNNNINNYLQFYAIEIKLIKIDESRPAIIFNVICEPNKIGDANLQTTTEISETKEKYKQFFQLLIDELREKYNFTGARLAQPQNWYTFSSSNSNIFKYTVTFTSKKYGASRRIY